MLVTDHKSIIIAILFCGLIFTSCKQSNKSDDSVVVDCDTATSDLAIATQQYVAKVSKENCIILKQTLEKYNKSSNCSQERKDGYKSIIDTLDCEE